MAYVKSRRQRQHDLAEVCRAQLMENVTQVCETINLRVPFLGSLLTKHFRHSAETEILLAEDGDTFMLASAELQDCHRSLCQSVLSNPLISGGSRTPWAALWHQQRVSMMTYLLRQGSQEEALCYDAATRIGQALDALRT